MSIQKKSEPGNKKRKRKRLGKAKAKIQCQRCGKSFKSATAAALCNDCRFDLGLLRPKTKGNLMKETGVRPEQQSSLDSFSIQHKAAQIARGILTELGNNNK